MVADFRGGQNGKLVNRVKARIEKKLEFAVAEVAIGRIWRIIYMSIRQAGTSAEGETSPFGGSGGIVLRADKMGGFL
jgi:hypothetical protein